MPKIYTSLLLFFLCTCCYGKHACCVKRLIFQPCDSDILSEGTVEGWGPGPKRVGWRLISTPAPWTGGTEAVHAGGWVCIPVCPDDATWGTGGAQSRPHFKSAVEGPESREMFLLLPKMVAEVWYVGKMGQTCACSYTVPWTAMQGGGHAARGSSSLQRCQSGGCCGCSGARLRSRAFCKSALTHGFLAVQKSLLLRVACLGDLLLSLSLENCSERHYTTAPPGRRNGQASSRGLRGVLFCPGPLKDFQVSRRPFPSIFLIVWRGHAAFQGGKSKMRFLQETWEIKMAMSSWFWAY